MVTIFKRIKILNHYVIYLNNVMVVVEVVVQSLSCVQLFVNPWTVALQAPLAMGFPRQEYWSGLPFPSLGDLPDPGIELGSPTLWADALPSEPPGSKLLLLRHNFSFQYSQVETIESLLIFICFCHRCLKIALKKNNRDLRTTQKNLKISR